MIYYKEKYYVDGDYQLFFSDKGNANIYTSIYSSSNTNCSLIRLNPEIQKKLNYRTFNEVTKFYNQNELHFKKILNELGIDIWFLEHFRMYFNYRNFFLKLECVKNYLEKESNGIVISSDKNLIHFLETTKIQFVKQKAKKRIDYKRAIKEFLFILSQRKYLKHSNKKHVLLSRISDNFNGNDKRFGSLELVYEKILIRDLFNLSKPLPDLKSTPKKLLNSDHIFLNYLSKFKWPFDLFKFNNALKRLKRNLLNQNNLSNNKHKIILDLFWKNRMSFFIYYMRFKSFDHYFKKVKISGILLIDENSPQQKVIQYAASRNNIKIFGFQHGNIHSLHPAYIYGNYTSKPLLPDITFTWGKYFTNLLIDQGGYSKERVDTTGRISPDQGFRYLNPLIDKKNKIIVYATQPQRDPLLRRQQIIDVLLTAKAIADKVQLIIRPHPREEEDIYFLKIGEEINFLNFIIDRESDLRTHFEICDILITSFSTVGSEFIPYYKPLLVLDYLNQDLVGWIREGVGIPIKNQNELINTLTQQQLEINEESYDKFIENYFYKTDENTVERIKYIIDGS